MSGKQMKKIVKVIGQGRLPERDGLRKVTRRQPCRGGSDGEIKAEERKA